MACAVAVRVVDEVEVEEDDAEAAARSRCAMERCTRGAKIVAKVFLKRVAVLLSPLRRERRQENTLAWTRTTRSGARSLLVDSVACAVAVRVVDEVGVEEDDAGAAARSRRARIISRPKKCLFGPGLDLMEWLRKMNKIPQQAQSALSSALCAFLARILASNGFFRSLLLQLLTSKSRTQKFNRQVL